VPSIAVPSSKVTVTSRIWVQCERQDLLG